jgi:hypothetical protein
MDVTLLSDDELVAVVKNSGCVFKEAYVNIVPVLREIKLRFLEARREHKSYLGYSSFNRLCDEKLVVSHQAIRRLVSDVKLQKHPVNVPWYVRIFGADVEARHEEECKKILDLLYDAFRDFNFGGWAPWKPKTGSDKKVWNPIEDRYKVTLFLSKGEIEAMCQIMTGEKQRAKNEETICGEVVRKAE